MDSYIIVTNNIDVKKLKEFNLIKDILFRNVQIPKIIWLCQNLIMEGWRLISDPLAGRYGRPNPYITVILEKINSEENREYDISRIEKIMDLYYQNEKHYGSLTSKVHKGYQVVDREIALTCLKSIIKSKVCS